MWDQQLLAELNPYRSFWALTIRKSMIETKRWLIARDKKEELKEGTHEEKWGV